ncbi:MAG TPA: TonB-dependent receptor [Bryobacteraceae bacterium]|nr:TonB-dependent receptor [Bryobacteraceae bacterium]
MKCAAGLVVAAAFLFLTAPRVSAQEVNVAEVDGHVTDPTGASVSGAIAKMTDTDTHQVHTFTTDNSGGFRFPNLPIGTYTLEVTASGFKLYRQTGIILEVAHNVEQNVALQVGATTDTVEVTANASMVETKDSAIAQVMEERKIVDLPLNGRNLTQLLTLTGGGTSTPGGDLTGSKNIQGSNASGTFSVAGGQANGINYLLDGGDNNDTFSNVNLPIPFPDAVQEFSVQTNAMQAQFGLHPGGVVNIVTKAGTNDYHGDLFDFLRNYELNARTKGLVEPGGAVAQPARDSLKRNQFGGVIGGKIKKDKLFFFAGYQQTVQRSNPATNTAHVPTALTIAGNFSVEDAATSAGGCQKSAITLKDPTTGNAIPGNRIPQSEFDKAALKLLSFVPISSDNCGTLLYGQPADNPDWQVIGRVDYVINDKHSMYGRYYNYNYTAQAFFDGKNVLTTGPNPGNKDNSIIATFGDTYLFSPTMVNSFHATYNRRADNRGSAPNLFGPQALGIQNGSGGPFADNMPDNYIQVTVSNYFNVACGTCAPGYFNVNNYQLSDDVSKIIGRHQIAWGFDGRKDQFNETANQQSNGQWNFSGGSTAGYSGDNLADLLLGHLSSWNQGNALSDYIRQTVFALYLQDSWKATDHLTVNIGARWEPLQPAYDKYCRGNWLDMAAYVAGVHSTEYPNAPIGLIFGHDSQDPNGCPFAAHHWGDTSPRLGLVWDPTGNGKQTIRAAFGLLHDTTELFYPERWTTNPPYASSITLTNPSISAPFSNPWAPDPGIWAGGDPFPGASIFPPSGTYVSVPPNLHPTYVLQWNLSYSRQIAKDWLATATYIGNHTVHIYGAYDINEPQPSPTATTKNEQARRVLSLINPTAGASYAQVVQSDDGVTASYEALLLKLEHRFGNHFTMLSNYTWSQCISTYDFGGELAGVDYQNQFNRDGEKADCNFDRRHIFNTSLVAESPGFGTGALQAISKDWQIAPIISFYTGQPFTVTTGSDVSLTGEGTDRPNVVPNVSNPFPKTTSEWFNTSLFAGGCNNATYASNPYCVPLGNFGDAARDIFHGPGTIQWDMSASRIFAFNERLKLQYKAEFFNIMNHANWNAPSASLTSGTYGQVTTFGSPRLIQMSLKFMF